MPPERPVAVEDLSSASEPALRTWIHKLNIEAQQYAFRHGLGLILFVVVVYVIVSLEAVAAYFTPEFRSNSWSFARFGMGLGAALASPQIAKNIKDLFTGG